MRILIYFIRFLLLSCFLTLPSFAQVLNKTAIALCEDGYEQCASNGTVAFPNCTQTFNSCLDQNAYMPPKKPLDCFRSKAAWEAADYQLYASIGIFMGTFLGIPAGAKALSKLINFASAKKNGQMRCGCFGHLLLFFTDGDEDGVVKPNELLQPALAFLGGFSFTTFLSAKVDAIKAQAECDYAKEQKPAG